MTPTSNAMVARGDQESVTGGVGVELKQQLLAAQTIILCSVRGLPSAPCHWSRVGREPTNPLRSEHVLSGTRHAFELATVFGELATSEWARSLGL